MTQQARNLVWDQQEDGSSVRFLIRDNDANFGAAFDEVFHSEGIDVVRTPVEAPRASAIAERFVGTVRRECLDCLLIANRRHLERSLRTFIDHYNGHRPHRGLGLAAPDRSNVVSMPSRPTSASRVNRRERLGGLINEYRAAACAGRPSHTFRAAKPGVSAAACRQALRASTALTALSDPETGSPDRPRTIQPRPT